MKKIVVLIFLSLSILILSISFLPLSPIQGMDSEKIERLELKYIDSNLYIASCNANDISEIAVYYRHKGNEMKCIKWVHKCNLCRKKHIEIKNVTLLNEDDFCKTL